jgi:hypothetical protein
MRGLDRLRRVLELLGRADCDRRERLQAAGYEFLLAAVGRESWPAGLRGEAEQVRAGLLTAGVGGGGLWEASDAEVAWLTDDLTRFCRRACGVRPPRRPARVRCEPVLC